MSTAYLFNKIFLDHDTGWGHPETSARLEKINAKIKSAPYFKKLYTVKTRMPEMRYIEMIHTREYIERVKEEIESGSGFIDSMDTAVSSKSYNVALHAVGGCLNMCDAIMTGKARNGFCAIRPPGHHAERTYAAGFCIFNNIAIAARYLQTKYDLNHIAIIDWDVHHGNGTQHSFEDDNSVYYLSLHQFPHYPGTGSKHEKGRGMGQGFTQNYPMTVGAGDEEYLQIFTNQITPALNEFKPEAILISAGFDAHMSDPLSSIKLSTEAYYTLTRILMDIADKNCSGRVIAFLEGGYNLNILGDCVEQVMNAFIEE